MLNVSVSPAEWTVNPNEGTQPARSRTMVFFYDREIQDNYQTEQQGRPIFKTITFIKKIPPGDKLVEIDTKATNRDFQKFPAEYEAYKKKQANPVTGTPLSAWAQLARNQVAEMNALNIYTVEQLAELPDQYGQQMMGYQGLKQKAQSFLRAAKGQSEFEKMETLLRSRDEENEKLRQQVTDALEEQKSMLAIMQEMQKSIEAMKTANTPKKGKPKDEDEE